MKPVDQSSFESLNSEVRPGNLFSSVCGFLNVESISLLSYGRSAEYSVSHLVYSNTK